MATAMDVFRMIKMISPKTLNPAPRILLTEIATGMSLEADNLLLMVIELRMLGLIRINQTKLLTVNLTQYGVIRSV